MSWLFWIGAALAAIGLVVLFTPVAAAAAGGINRASVYGSARVWWGHPVILLVQYDPDGVLFRMCGFARRFGGVKEPDRDDEASSQPERMSVVPEQTKESHSEPPDPPAFRSAPPRKDRHDFTFSGSDNKKEKPMETTGDEEAVPPHPRGRVDNATEEKTEKRQPGEHGEEKNAHQNARAQGAEQKRSRFAVWKSRWDAFMNHPAMIMLGRKRWRRNIVSWIGRIVRSALSIVRIDRFKGYCVYPALSYPVAGITYGIVESLRAAGNPHSLIDVKVVPDWNEEEWSVEGAVELHTSPAALIKPAVVALFTFPYFSTGLLWWNIRKRRKSPTSAS